jgi:O-antigen biosynthesis protein WbqP
MNKTNASSNNDYKARTAQKIYLPFKRIIGIFGSILGIIFCVALLWWWVLPINAIVTKGKPFFVQKRLGKNKKVFGLIKFRSMRVNANPNLAPSDMNEEKQVSMETGFGRFLRKTSIDETPQLLNILAGQMAFIGPRPGAAVNEESLVIARDSYSPSAYCVKPGLSGLAQVKMKREHDPMLKAKFDHEYVLKMSFWLDCRLFVGTILKLFGSGAR